MKRKLIIICGVLLLISATCICGRFVQVCSFLNSQEEMIKQALRVAGPDQLLSNASDGAERFVKTGELVLEPAYLLRPEKMEKLQMFNMRVAPRVCTGRNDGWVGIYQGHWYVKIY